MRIEAARVVFVVPFAALLAAALPRGWEPSQQATPEVKDTPLSGPVHMLEGRGGNIGVSIGPDGLLMVDDQDPGIAPKVQAAIDALAGGSKAPRFLVNTHFHGDHTGANAIFGQGATVIAHDNVRKRLAEAKDKPMPPEGLPVVTYAQSASVHFNGEEIRLMHYPACHTDGDTVVWFTKSNVVHLGDLFFHQRFPFIDRKSGGSAVSLERAIADLAGKVPADAKLIPGHGPVATVGDLKGYQAMLADTLALVRKALADGKTLEQMKQEKLLAKYESLSWQFISTDAYLGTLVDELSAEVKARK